MHGNRSQRPRPRAQDGGIKCWERLCVRRRQFHQMVNCIPPCRSPSHCSLTDSWETWGSVLGHFSHSCTHVHECVQTSFEEMQQRVKMISCIILPSVKTYHYSSHHVQLLNTKQDGVKNEQALHVLPMSTLMLIKAHIRSCTDLIGLPVSCRIRELWLL